MSFQVGALGLIRAYHKDAGTRDVVKSIFIMPLLPVNQVVPLYKRLLKLCKNAPTLTKLLAYLEKQWLRNPVVSINAWNCFERTTRTNNDAEGIYENRTFIQNTV